MNIRELIQATPIFSHIPYENLPMTAEKMDLELCLEYGERTLKPAINNMIQDLQASSYLDIIGSIILSMYSYKWDKLKDISSKTIDQLSQETETTTYNESNSQTSINSVWGISDVESQNKDKSNSDGSTSQTTQTTKGSVIDIDKALKLSNINIASVIVCDVANYLSLYVIE